MHLVHGIVRALVEFEGLGIPTRAFLGLRQQPCSDREIDRRQSALIDERGQVLPYFVVFLLALREICEGEASHVVTRIYLHGLLSQRPGFSQLMFSFQDGGEVGEGVGEITLLPDDLSIERLGAFVVVLSATQVSEVVACVDVAGIDLDRLFETRLGVIQMSECSEEQAKTVQQVHVAGRGPKSLAEELHRLLELTAIPGDIAKDVQSVGLVRLLLQDLDADRHGLVRLTALIKVDRVLKLCGIHGFTHLGCSVASVKRSFHLCTSVGSLFRLLAIQKRNSNVDVLNEQEAAAMAEVAGSEDHPVLMMNLNRYKPGEFPDGALNREWRKVNAEMIGNVGGRILWTLPVKGYILSNGPEEPLDEILAYWYPSHQSFLDMRGFEIRQELVEYAIVHRCNGETPPVLSALPGSE